MFHKNESKGLQRRYDRHVWGMSKWDGINIVDKCSGGKKMELNYELIHDNELKRIRRKT